jgi:hypothetical protein
MTLALAILVLLPPPPVAAAPCDTPIKSKVACENTKTGTPESTWKVSGAGSSNLQGFSTDISVNVGATIGFKIDTTLSSYSMDIYRMGYYQGNGARKIASVSAPTATDQPACKTESTTGLIDCGNWSQSASWTAPSDAVSGIYFALISSGSSKSQIPFVVRDDSSHSDLFMQTSDTTWQAYNSWGGNSFYVGGPGTSGNTPRAYKLSYNRPFATNSGDTVHDYIYNAEYPMVRFLESNGYDVSYTTGVDSDRYGALIKNHKTFLSVGHDEYWSGNQRANVEAARDAGVNLAFFSGNEVFWKTRYENSAYGTTTDHRTLVTYKETHSGAKIDPKDPPTWTGTWRDPRFSPPADGGRPENNLTGTIFTVNCCTTDMHVGGAYKNLRFWRNTRVASLGASQTTTLGDGILGYEWDESPDNGFRPAGLVFLSSDSQNVSSLLQDYGSTYAPGSATHHLTLYRAPSGALVFGAGSVQWAWGLDDDHATDGPTNTVDVAVQQATVNLFADMGAQPTTLQSGLVAAAASTDTTPPTSAITAPADGATVAVGSPLTISGTASDVGGVVAGVEVSIDGGTSWHPATGTTSWSYAFTPSVNGTLSIKSRATDDSARTENPGAGRTVTVGSGTPPAGDCPCTIWPSSATPVSESDEDNAAIEVGVKFRANQNGFITGLRFYKGGLNTGTHVGSLWSAGGTKLASATFTNESGSGWQQVDFATPVPVTANTTYVASYYASNGHYASTDGYFTTPTANGPLTALADNADGPNGVYKYGGTGFPTLGYSASNYWVDVVFVKSSAPDTTKPTVTSRQPAAGAASVDTSIKPSATFSEGVSNATIALTKQSDGTTIIGATSYDAGSQTATFTPTVSLEASTTYTVAVSGAKDAAGNVMDPVSWSYTTAGTISSGCPCTIWPSTALPASAADPDNGSIEVGVKFRANQAGWINGVRFYKDSTNTGTHVGSLWSSTGARLASATFTGESTSGWQEVAFATPVPVTANTTYVASYLAPAGHYSVSESYFTAATTNGPLTALADNTDGPNGVYLYGTGGFPTQTYASSNYWVDVVFSTSTTPPPDTTKPTVASHQPGSSAVDVATAFKPTATFSEDVSNASITMKNGSTTVAGTTSYDSPSKTATFTPSAALANATTYTVTVTGAKDAAGNVMDDLTWTFTTVAAVDTTPPTITARAPAASATGVATSTTVTATFSEPVQAATIAMTVTPAGGSAVAGSVAYNATSRMATFTPTAALATSTTYTVAVSGTKDIAGNVMAPLTWTFTTAAPPATGSSIWASTVTPKVLADSDTAATELGVKFRTTTAGTITGIRFYKGPGNTGTHVGTLWSKAGVELAKVTFTGETASGWQQATFTTPVTVTANTTYVASYNAPNGHYSVNESYFSAAVTNGPLTALKNGTDGVNGVYRYGTRAFPSTGYKSSNYWVDVLFTS